MSTHKNRVKMTVSGTPGTGTITLSAASSGYQSFAAAYGANATVDILIEEGTAWEVARDCTYTNSGTTVTRGTFEASSTGSAVSFTSAAVVSEILTATKGDYSETALKGHISGGRLTLESGVPVSTTDQSAKTTIYYTPFVHNIISLWDGANWVPTEFTETSLALGTITSAKPYDVFGYLSGGALTLELLAWTDDTTRATAVTIQDGRYCKSGDKTRLLLGAFYTTATTTTEDSQKHRYLSNVYNKVGRRCFVSVAGETTTSSTLNEIDNAGADTDPRISLVAALTEGFNYGGTVAALSTVAADIARFTAYQNGSGGNSLFTYDIYCQTTAARAVGYGPAQVAPGKSYYSVWGARLSGSGTVTLSTVQTWGIWPC